MEQTTVITVISIFLITTFLSWRILGTNRKQLSKNIYKKWKSKWIFWQGVIYPSTNAQTCLESKVRAPL